MRPTAKAAGAKSQAIGGPPFASGTEEGKRVAHRLCAGDVNRGVRTSGDEAGSGLERGRQGRAARPVVNLGRGLEGGAVAPEPSGAALVELRQRRVTDLITGTAGRPHRSKRRRRDVQRWVQRRLVGGGGEARERLGADAEDGGWASATR
jgi:hypothetical protein